MGSIPILTIHKSKGLEFHTVVFLGLEDDAFFGFENDPEEETCGLFVALSRARNRAIFTFSSSRSVGRNSAKTRAAIEVYYDLFRQAGIAVEEID
jgi:DNA helicase-2/ATP-dependent DNA helicase PcrA